jgi:hypothetical protein
MPYGADSKRIVLTVASGARVRPAFPASGRRQRLNPFRRRFARRFRPDQLPLALNRFRQTSIAKPVQPGNTTRPRFVDRLSPVPDRAFGIRPHHREKTFVVAIALSPPAAEIRIIAIGARLAMAVGLAPAASSSLGPGLRWRVAADHASDELQNVGVASSDDESRGKRGRAITQSSGESIREDHEPGCLCSPARTASGKPQAARGTG